MEKLREKFTAAMRPVRMASTAARLVLFGGCINASERI
jgi:hypothetical protein